LAQDNGAGDAVLSDRPGYYEPSARFYDLLYSWKDYAGESERVDELIRRHDASARTLLDVACGTGRHLEYLRERYRVEGVDLDPKLLEIARGRLDDVPLHRADMLSFDLGRRFDVVVCLFSSIGYVTSLDDLQVAVRRMVEHLEPGGLLLIEPWLSPEGFIEGHIGALFFDEPELKVTRMNSTSVDGRLSYLHMHYLVGEAGEVSYFTEEHRLGLFTDTEYRDSLAGAGCDVTFDEDGLMGRGLYVARKL